MRPRYLVVAALVLAAFGVGLVVALPAVTPPSTIVPTTRPERGDLNVEIHARGELGPHQSITLSAPAVGTSLQLVRLAAAGTRINKGDLVMSFDPEGKRHELEQARADLQEAEQEILKVQADARVRAAEDDLALLEARFNLRICEMKAGGNEFVGAIEARKNLLAVDEARRKVEQLEQDARTHAASNQAALAALVEKRRKATLAIGVAERHIESMTVTAPISGLVMINQNQDATGGFFFMGMTIPDYREGDTVQPGSPVAAIVDLSAIEVNAKIDETSRTALSEGAVASVQIDGMPSSRLDAKATRLGGVAGRTFFWEAGSREFDAAFRLDRPAPVLRSGMTAALVASADPVRNALHLPRQALFEKEGKPVIYARRNGAFVPVEVKVLRLTESRVVVDGISVDEEVALSNPERSDNGAAQKSAAPSVPAAGG